MYTGPKLRNWQISAIKAWDVNKKGIIQAVPGSGKTFLAIKLFSDIYNQEKDLKILIVCPRLSLIEQWEKVILENSDFTKKDIYEISSKTEVKAHKKVQAIFNHHKIFISTFNQIKQFFSHKEWREKNWFLVVDEMHNTTEGFKFPNEIKYKLGLSATPKKKGKNSDFNLGGIVYAYSFKQALEDKIILDPVFKLVLYSVNEPVFRKINNESEKTEKLIEDSYDSILSDDNQGSFNQNNTDFIGIQKILTNSFNLGKENAYQSLIFVNRIKKANILNEVLLTQFKKTISHSHHSQSEDYSKKNNFSRISKGFENKKFNVLISVNTLGEGIDFPYASHGIIASPIYNPTNFIQKVGRLLRTYKDHKQAIIYYYIPSELITKILTDENISPNYLKEVLRIASERKNLFFVDRETLKEEQGTFEELIIQGSAYERNSEIKMMKVPSHIDMILRFSKKLFPASFKHWRTYCEENDYSGLEKRILMHSKILLRCTKNLTHNLKKVNNLQKKFKNTEFDYEKIKDFVKEGVRQNFVVKVKHGAELLTNIEESEKNLLQNTLNAELKEFIKKKQKLGKQIQNLEKIMKDYNSLSDKQKLNSLNKIAGIFFKIQSDYLDQLDLITISKNFDSDGATITFGKDIFILTQTKRAFSYPEDFGLSRWKIHEEKKEAETPKEELFLKELIEKEEEITKENFEKIKNNLLEKYKISKLKMNDKEIIHSLNKIKSNKHFSLLKIILLVEKIKNY